MSSSPAGPTDWSDDPKGILLAMERAIQSAGLAPDDMDVIQAAANGGKNPDLVETEACRRLFESAKKPFMTSIKGAVGESFSSGGIRAAALALSMKEGKVPPTLGLTDPIKPLNIVTGRSMKTDIRCGLMNGISYGGTNVSIVTKIIA